VIFIVSLEKAISQINFEMQQIDELFTAYSELLEKIKTKEPSLIEPHQTPCGNTGSFMVSLRFIAIKHSIPKQRPLLPPRCASRQ